MQRGDIERWGILLITKIKYFYCTQKANWGGVFLSHLLYNSICLTTIINIQMLVNKSLKLMSNNSYLK